MLTQEFAVALRALLLQLEFAPSDLVGIGAHSLKATTLSWCSKYGIDREVRCILGNHIRPGDRTMESYSRDSLGAPLRELQKVLDAVSKQTFDPDATRSGRFVEIAPASSGSSSASSASSDDDANDEELEPEPENEDDGHAIILNTRTNVHHLQVGEGLLCGKCIPNAHAVLGAVREGGRLCSRCF